MGLVLDDDGVLLGDMGATAGWGGGRGGWVGSWPAVLLGCGCSTRLTGSWAFRTRAPHPAAFLSCLLSDGEARFGRWCEGVKRRFLGFEIGEFFEVYGFWFLFDEGGAVCWGPYGSLSLFGFEVGCRWRERGVGVVLVVLKR